MSHRAPVETVIAAINGNDEKAVRFVVQDDLASPDMGALAPERRASGSSR